VTAERIRLAAGDLTLELAPEVGGSVAAYRRGARPLFRETPAGYVDVLASACFPLVPYSNRIFDGAFSFGGRDVRLPPNNPPQRHPLHGLGWRGAWSVLDAGERQAALAFDWPGGDWPWAFRAEQAFRLDDAGLTVDLSVENRSEAPMPAGLGLHPYFPCAPGTVLDARVSEVWTVDADLFPNGREPSVGRYDLTERPIHHADLDNGYGGWSGEARLRWPDGAGLRIRSEERFFQVYAPTSEDVLCAEPVTHANGALNAPPEEQAALGLVTLVPGERRVLTARFDPV
jgi:aldose 1-epimerase